MKALKGKLTLSKEKGNHKELYKSEAFKDGLIIPKKWDNNNRTRNACHGYVEGIDPDNELNVSLGDRVYTHHFVLMGDMSKPADERMLTPEGKEIFGCKLDDIFFKIPTDNWEDAECVNDYILATPIMEGGNSFEDAKPSKDKCVVEKYPKSLEGKVKEGDIVMVLPYALGYDVELGNVPMKRIRYREIVAFIEGDEFIPTEKFCIVKRDKANQAGLILMTTPPPKYTGTVMFAPEDYCVQAGDRIHFAKANHTTIHHNGEEYILIKQDHVNFKILA